MGQENNPSLTYKIVEALTYFIGVIGMNRFKKFWENKDEALSEAIISAEILLATEVTAMVAQLAAQGISPIDMEMALASDRVSVRSLRVAELWCQEC